MKALPMHPFPARMAPELALDRLPARRSTVLDPMMGSGTIPVLAALKGHVAYGFDTDPLALLIARVWGRPLTEKSLKIAAEHAVEEALQLAPTLRGPVHDDADTQEFIDYWFDPIAQQKLKALATGIRSSPKNLRPALWCAFSRLIITKDAGASLARDVSHSRPHRVRETASFDPIERFVASAQAVVRRHQQSGDSRPTGKLFLKRGDARSLPLPSRSVQFVMTSPPYVNAIDYLRGHRLSLVWMGHTVAHLRRLRSDSVGTPAAGRHQHEEDLVESVADGKLSHLDDRVLRRYVKDLDQVFSETRRVLRSGGTSVFVVADATMHGVRIQVGSLLEQLGKRHHLILTDRETRALPDNHRYLPPPSASKGNPLARRMREETCLVFLKP